MTISLMLQMLIFLSPAPAETAARAAEFSVIFETECQLYLIAIEMKSRVNIILAAPFLYEFGSVCGEN